MCSIPRDSEHSKDRVSSFEYKGSFMSAPYEHGQASCSPKTNNLKPSTNVQSICASLYIIYDAKQWRSHLFVLNIFWKSSSSSKTSAFGILSFYSLSTLLSGILGLGASTLSIFCCLLWQLFSCFVSSLHMLLGIITLWSHLIDVSLETTVEPIARLLIRLRLLSSSGGPAWNY